MRFLIVTSSSSVASCLNVSVLSCVKIIHKMLIRMSLSLIIPILTAILSVASASTAQMKDEFCPEPNHVYYRVRTRYRSEMDKFQRIFDPIQFQLPNGIYYAHDSISLTFLQFVPSPTSSHSSKLSSANGGNAVEAADPRYFTIKVRSSKKAAINGHQFTVIDPLARLQCNSRPITFKPGLLGSLGGWADELDARGQTPLCVTYRLPVRTMSDAQSVLGTVDLRCQSSTSMAGYFLIHHFRFIVPYSPSSSSTSAADGGGGPDVPEVVQMDLTVKEGRKMEYFTNFYAAPSLLDPRRLREHYHSKDSSSNDHQKLNQNHQEPAQLFTSMPAQESLMTPQYPDILHTSQNITRHAIIFPDANPQLYSGMWDPTASPTEGGWFKLSFHQIRIFGLYPQRGLAIYLKRIPTWQKPAQPSKDSKGENNQDKDTGENDNEGGRHLVVNIIDSKSYECSHAEGFFRRYRNEHDQEYMKYFDPLRTDEQQIPCDLSSSSGSSAGMKNHLCRSFENDLFQVRYIVYAHSRKVSKQFLGLESLDKTGGTLYSYVVWIRLKSQHQTETTVTELKREKVPNGIYAFELVNNQIVASRPDSRLNVMGRIRSLTNAFALHRLANHPQNFENNNNVDNSESLNRKIVSMYEDDLVSKQFGLGTLAKQEDEKSLLRRRLWFSEHENSDDEDQGEAETEGQDYTRTVSGHGYSGGSRGSRGSSAGSKRLRGKRMSGTTSSSLGNAEQDDQPLIVYEKENAIELFRVTKMAENSILDSGAPESSMSVRTKIMMYQDDYEIVNFCSYYNPLHGSMHYEIPTPESITTHLLS